MIRVDCQASIPEAGLAEARTALLAGELVAFPTETVYGLGARAADAAAVERIYGAKGRPDGKPISLLVPDVGAARHCAAVWPTAADRLARACWPGPLTVVVPAAAHVPAAVLAGGVTVGLRVPAHPVALALLEAVGEALATPSANRSGEPAPTSADGVLAALDADVFAYLLDGGETAVGIASTVVSCAPDASGGAIEILRVGAMSEAEVRALAGVTECK